MSITVMEVLTEVSKSMRDEVNFIWDLQTELLPLLNRAVPELVWRDPYASVFNMPFATAAGVLQTIPADAVALINVKRNLGANGTTPGNIITDVPRDSLDADLPSWPTTTAAAPIHYVFDSRDPRRFYLWPQPPSPWFVELEYAQVPNDVAIGDPFPLPEMYAAAVQHWIKAIAYSSNMELYGGIGAKLSEFYMAQFNATMAATVPAIGESVPKNTVNRT